VNPEDISSWRNQERFLERHNLLIVDWKMRGKENEKYISSNSNIFLEVRRYGNVVK